MKIAIACDHAGFPLKETVIEEVEKLGMEALDLGTYNTDSVDYPDYAKLLAEAILEGKADRGILLCGSGVGASIAVNKFKGIYAGLCHDTYTAHQGVEHDTMNVLCLGARVIGPELCKEIVPSFLNARFDPQERHIRRTDKFKKFEEC